jgi:hypothetical protein
LAFDFYIIPAAKLKDCGVFGVSSDEIELRRLEESAAGREARGREVVEEMVEQLRPPEQAPKPGGTGVVGLVSR